MGTETSSLVAVHAFLALLLGQVHSSADQRAECTLKSGTKNSTCIGSNDRSAVLLQRDTQITQLSAYDGVGGSGVCPYHQNSGTDCGFDGITEHECESRGCCWDPTSPAMWCYPRGPAQNSGMCPYHTNSGDDCGFVGITQQQCEDRGCCWDPTSTTMLCYPRGPAVGNENTVTVTPAVTPHGLQNSGMCPYHANSGNDCGFVGITQQQCEDRGCCWDPTSTKMLCYPRGPAVGNENAVTVTPAATRFLSWNVYYANDLRGRAGRVADGIIEVAAEIVSLQEMWHEWDVILQQLNRRMPNSWSFARGGQTEKVWDGDILFRSDLWKLEGSGVRAYGDRGISWAALKRKSDGVGVIAAGTHPWCCTNGEPILRTVQYELLALMKQVRVEYPRYPAAVMGDFNANYYNHAMYLMREGRRSGFNREWSIFPYAFKDSYAIDGHNPDESTGFGVKIDFVYFEETPLHMGEVVGSKIWGDCRKAGSDHCGVSGDIVLSNTHVGGGDGTTAPA